MGRIKLPRAFYLIGFTAIFLLGAYSLTGVQATDKSDVFETEPLAAPARNGDPVRYRIDPRQSHFVVRAFAGGLLSAVAGHNHTIEVRDLGGETQFTYGTFEPAALRLTVKAASLAVVDKVSDKDRAQIEQTMRDQVLETASYPEIAFASTSVSASRVAEGQYQVQIHGKLSLHGEIRHIVVAARVDLTADSLRARGDIPLKQTDYHIKPVSVAGGAIKVKDEIKLSFDITSHR
jgi:polyisoprenoid-binding protein YceI